MTPVRSVRYLRSADIGLCDSKRGGWLHGYLTNDSLLVNGGHGIIPTIDDKSGERHLVVHVVSGAYSHVVERDGQCKQQRARIVPVVFGFDDFKAQRCYKLSEINLKALADGR